MNKNNIRNIVIGVTLALVVFAAITGGALAERMFGIKPLDLIFPQDETDISRSVERKILKE